MTSISPVVVGAPPFAYLYIAGMPAGTVRVQVTRTWQGVAQRVRGDEQAVVVGSGVLVEDWALPVGDGPVGYSAQPISATGAPLGAPGVVTVAAPTIDHSMVWLSDPHDPMGSALVGLLASDDGEAASSAVQVVTPISGPPLAIGAPRTARQRSWQVVVTDEPTARIVDTILHCGTSARIGGTGVLLLRGAPECLDHPTGVLYVTAPTVERSRTLPHEPRVVWGWAGVETRGPMAPPAVARRTYQDDLDEQPTYAASLAAYPTYLDRVQAGL